MPCFCCVFFLMILFPNIAFFYSNAGHFMKTIVTLDVIFFQREYSAYFRRQERGKAAQFNPGLNSVLVSFSLP